MIGGEKVTVKRYDISKKKLEDFKKKYPKKLIFTYKDNVFQIVPKRLWRSVVVALLFIPFLIAVAFGFITYWIYETFAFFIEWYSDFNDEYIAFVYGKIKDENEEEEEFTITFKNPNE